MDSLKLYIETNIRDKSVSLSQIPELFQKAGFQVGTPVYENIQKIISDNNINVEAILDILISNLFAIFDLEQENDKKTFISMRAVLRKVVIEKMSEQLNIAQIEHFNWQQICQVFEEHVGMSDIEQSEKWYTYFEENDTNGNFLLSMKIETELEPFAKKLGLNDDQQKRLTKLLAEIQPKEENPDLNDDQEEGPAEIQTNKALLKKYIETNIKDQTIMLNTIPELFLKAGFKEGTSVYKEIIKIISAKEIDVGTILNTPKSELFEMFNLQEEIDKNKFISMRAILRKVVIEKMSEQLNIAQIEHFNWQQICQVFEEHVGMSDIEQSEKWYNYFEENETNGSVLLSMKIKTELEPFAKKLGLNDDQQKRLAKLLAEIQPKEENPDLNDDQEEGPAEIQTNKALLKKYIEANIKDQTIMLNTIPELFLKAGFKEGTSVYKKIIEIISENEIDVGTILNTPKSELFEMFNLQEEIDKNKFISMRAILRKVVIEKMSEQLNIAQIEHFNWQQICQVFEEHVGMSDIEQSEKWYTYFEENETNGSVLLSMKIETELEPFAKKLGLNDDQQKGLAKLLAEIQPKEENPDLNDDQEEGPAEIQTNKALLKKYIETNIKDQTIMLNTIPELFLKAGFKEGTSVYKEIIKIISEKEIDVGTILNTPKSELFEMFNLQEEIDKNKFISMRAILRKVVIEKMSEQLNIAQIEHFNWQQISQVFEEHVGMSDIEQSEKWYNYFEENETNGSVLLSMKIETELEPFAKKLGLNDDQQKRLAKLLAEIQPKEENPDLNDDQEEGPAEIQINKALLKKYIEANIKDQTIMLNTIPELFRKAGFKEGTSVYKEIIEIISENEIDVGTILNTPKSELFEMFNLQEEIDKNKFISMRAVLRKVVIEKMSEQLNIAQIEHFNWQQICQVFEEHVGMSDIEQSEKWYTYFEENGINGSVLLSMKIKTELEPFAKKLGLNDGQQKGLAKLLAEIQPKEEVAHSRHMSLENGATGFMSMDSHVHTRDIHVGRHLPEGQ